MGKDAELKKEIETLNKQIDELSIEKTEYQKVNREINEAIDNFEDMKKNISKAQEYLKEGDTGEETLKQIKEMDEDKKNVNQVIGSLEGIQDEANKEIRKINNEIMEKNNQIKKVRNEIEKERKSTNNKN